MLTGDVKALLISCLQEFVAGFQARRKKVTNETVKNFMAVRKINPFPKNWEAGKKFIEDNKPTAPKAQEKTAAKEETKKEAKPTYKLVTDCLSNHMTVASLIAADITKSQVETSVDTKAQNTPMLETPQGVKVTEAFAIASFLARESHQDKLLGKSIFA